MIRVFSEVIPPAGASLELDRAEAHHLLSVRRVRDDEMVEVIDGKGGCATGTIRATGKKSAVVDIERHLEVVRESRLHLEVAAACPSSPGTFDHFLPGLVQLGVNVIYRPATRYSGAVKKKGDNYAQRLDGIVLEAMKQSGRLVKPQIDLDLGWEAVCTKMAAANARNFLFHPKGTASVEAGPAGSVKSVGLLIGPEGGFTEEEVATAQALGIELYDLGPRILKMETAVIGACFWAQQVFGGSE